MKIIIAGSRQFSDYTFLKAKMDRLTSKLKKKPVILSGHAKGADRLGERWAFEAGCDKLIFHLGGYKTIVCNGKKIDGYQARNYDMANGVKVIVCFLKGKPDPELEDLFSVAAERGIEIKTYQQPQADWKKKLLEKA